MVQLESPNPRANDMSLLHADGRLTHNSNGSLVTLSCSNRLVRQDAISLLTMGGMANVGVFDQFNCPILRLVTGMRIEIHLDPIHGEIVNWWPVGVR